MPNLESSLIETKDYSTVTTSSRKPFEILVAPCSIIASAFLVYVSLFLFNNYKQAYKKIPAGNGGAVEYDTALPLPDSLRFRSKDEKPSLHDSFVGKLVLRCFIRNRNCHQLSFQAFLG